MLKLLFVIDFSSFCNCVANHLKAYTTPLHKPPKLQLRSNQRQVKHFANIMNCANIEVISVSLKATVYQQSSLQYVNGALVDRQIIWRLWSPAKISDMNTLTHWKLELNPHCRSGFAFYNKSNHKSNNKGPWGKFTFKYYTWSHLQLLEFSH